MQAESRILIDTNVLVHAAASDSDKHGVAIRAIEQACQEGRGVLSAQNMAEFIYFAVEKKKGLTVEEATTVIRELSSDAAVIAYSREDVFRAGAILSSQRIHFFDALLAATMESNGVFSIMTENEKDFKKIPWIKVENPFR